MLVRIKINAIASTINNFFMTTSLLLLLNPKPEYVLGKPVHPNLKILSDTQDLLDLIDRNCKLLANKRKKIRSLDSSLIATG